MPAAACIRSAATHTATTSGTIPVLSRSAAAAAATATATAALVAASAAAMTAAGLSASARPIPRIFLTSRSTIRLFVHIRRSRHESIPAIGVVTFKQVIELHFT